MPDNQKPQPNPTLEESIARMQAELVDLVRAGAIPKTVTSFSELHDHMDANCLGGFCEDDISDSLLAYFTKEGDSGMPSGYIDYLNAAQGAIEKWIASGEMAAAVDRDAPSAASSTTP